MLSLSVRSARCPQRKIIYRACRCSVWRRDIHNITYNVHTRSNISRSHPESIVLLLPSTPTRIRTHVRSKTNLTTPTPTHAEDKPVGTTKKLLLAVALATLSAALFRYILVRTEKNQNNNKTKDTIKTSTITADKTAASCPSSSSIDLSCSIAPDILSVVGNTPLLELRSLSDITGRRICAKMEYLNPGGSVKDRAAKALLLAVEEQRQGQQNSTTNTPGYATGNETETVGTNTNNQSRPVLIEATGGNTGIGLAVLAPRFGYDCVFTYPDKISADKIDFLRTLGAAALPAPVVPFTDPRHFYHMAEHLLQVTPNSYATHQFEHDANWQTHYNTTGPEIWKQTQGQMHGFVCSCGTGGTLAGVSQFLKQHNPQIVTALIDPPASALYNYYQNGTLLGREDAETKRITVVEGIGNYRITGNQSHALVDVVYAGDEKEAIHMAYYLLLHEGVFVGASAALNVCGAVKLARSLPPGSTVVTVLCDGGGTYRNKLFNREWITAQGMERVLDKRMSKRVDFVS